MKVLRHRLVEDDGTPFPFERSPNSGGEVEHDLLVMHYTAGRSAESSVEWFENPLAKASAHLVVGRDGGIVQMVPFDRVAWHAGISEWQGRSGVNRFSLGIELDNAGKLMPHGERWRAWSHPGEGRHRPPPAWRSRPERAKRAGFPLSRGPGAGGRGGQGVRDWEGARAGGRERGPGGEDSCAPPG